MIINLHSAIGEFENIGLEPAILNCAGGRIQAAFNLYHNPDYKAQGLLPFFSYDLQADYSESFLGQPLMATIIQLLTATGDFTFILEE